MKSTINSLRTNTRYFEFVREQTLPKDQNCRARIGKGHQHSRKNNDVPKPADSGPHHIDTTEGQNNRKKWFKGQK